MKAEDFAKSIDELYERLRSLTATKGEEYKRREDNQFANFERGASENGITREQVLMIYLSKHLDSIRTYVKDRALGQEKVYAEPISGRIDDAILYLLLLRGMTVENDRARDRCTLDDCVQRYDNIENFGGFPAIPTPELAKRVALRDLRPLIRPYRPGEMLYNVECRLPLFTSDRMDLSHAMDPITRAFAQMAKGPELLPASPSPENAPPYRTTVVVSAKSTEAVSVVKELGLEPATAALSTPDQLYGMLGPDTRVIFLHHGGRNDELLHDEVKAKCEKQGLTFEVRYL